MQRTANKWILVLVGLIVLALVIALHAQTTPPAVPRLAFEQTATATEIKAMSWIAYIDSVRSPLAGVSCAAAAILNSFTCSVNLPTLANGPHGIEVVAVLTDSAGLVESPRSVPLAVRFPIVGAPLSLRVEMPKQ